MVEGYATMARDNHAFAGFSKIRIDDAGEPDPNDLYLAWAAGARVFRLVPQLICRETVPKVEDSSLPVEALVRPGGHGPDCAVLHWVCGGFPCDEKRSLAVRSRRSEES